MNEGITKLTIEYNLGDVVYQRLDSEQIPKFIIGILLTHGSVRYLCNGPDGEQWLYNFEITPQKAYTSYN